MNTDGYNREVKKETSLFEGKHGIILIDKPKNWTSHDCVSLVRKKIGVKRVGHTGTLDPMATGVLPICIGTATRLMDYTDHDWKEYVCRIRFGIKTDTADIWGDVIEKKELPEKTQRETADVLKSFLGEIEQVPPKFSALKVNGKKLYEYARAGQEIEIKSRKVRIKNIELTDLEFSKDNPQKIFSMKLKVVCSKGTYIRTLCEDISDELGTVGTMNFLRRTASGRFKIEKAINIEEFREMEQRDIMKILIDTDFPLCGFGRINLNLKFSRDFVNGKKTNLLKRIKSGDEGIFIEKDEVENKIDNTIEGKIGDKILPQNLYRVYFENMFLGIGRVEKGILMPDKVFDVGLQKMEEHSNMK